jgi:hypothetical protein
MEFLNVSEEFYNSETMGLDKQRGTITYSIARNLLANGMID